MAAPHVSGTAVLLSDWWRDQNGGAIPSPAMIKALLINGAKDYGGGGAIPNTTQGWGRIDLPGSLGLEYLSDRIKHFGLIRSDRYSRSPMACPRRTSP